MLRSLVVFVTLFLCPVYAADNDYDVQQRIFQHFLKRAQEGDMNSQFIVGHRYEIGVGTKQDMALANSWYKKAAEQGHPMAQQKLDRQHAAAEESEDKQKQEAEARAREQAVRAREQAQAQAAARAREQAEATRRAEAARQAEAARRAAARRAETAPAPIAEPGNLVQAAVREPAEPTYDTISLVLNGSWWRSQNAAEYLPSHTTHCLRSGKAEVTCFSDALNGNVGDASVVYTIKSILSGFQPNGSFKVNYIYNVVDISKRRSERATTPPVDTELKLTPGWQEPGLVAECRLQNERNVQCSKDRRSWIQFATR